ncbi:hypothetical protein [Bacteroides fragilis]|uniref:hypothetical protein n=2 Tax=Bacteroides fragilis TaxID=817 RepID=UPI0004B19137|nr:hypothetical protein [Bacteroides fragilis]
MNHHILHTLRRLCASALVLGAMWAATSCTAELSSEVHPGGGGVAGESEVTLHLQVPSADGSQTRAVDAATESQVNDLYILAFKVDRDDNSEKFDYFVTASKTATATEWTANLRVRQEQQTFVMVANAQGTPGKVNEQIAALAAGSVGHKKDDVLAKLTDALTAAEQTAGFNAATTTDHHPFTMYGQTAPTVITADAGIRLDVRMHRIVARVQVSFTGDAAGTKFTPQEVNLYNYNDRARVIPDHLTQTVDGTYEAAPPIPAGAVRLPATVDGKQVVPTYTVDADQKIEHQIYLFETAQPVGGTPEEQHVKRPCLIVKGLYDGATTPCYYRIDFFGEKTAGSGVKEYMEIVRNHSYNVTVQGVFAPGHDTPEEALTAQAANITATVVQWNDANIGDIDFDGQHVLGIATMKYQLGKKGSDAGTLLQQVKASVGLKWTANLYAVDDHGNVDTNTQPDWISFEGGAKEASGTGNNQLQDLMFMVARNDATPERRAVMRFTARNLMVEALVVQDQSSPVYITVKVNGQEITEQEFERLGGWNPDVMTIEYGPEQTELMWQYGAQGLVLTNKRVDGTETADLKGSANSGPQEEAEMTWQGEAGELPDTGQDYETRTGILTLIAKGKEGVVAKSIRLFQKKYGVTLQKSRVMCSSKQETIKVKGNMPWLLTMGDGYQDVLDNNMINPYDGMTMGNSADDYIHSPYYLLFKTKQADLTLGTKQAKFIFTHQERANISVEKTINFMGAFQYGNKYYEVLGPVMRSFKDVAAKKGYEDENGDPVPDAAMITQIQGNQLNDLGLTEWEISADAKLEAGVKMTTHVGLLPDDLRTPLDLDLVKDGDECIPTVSWPIQMTAHWVVQARGMNITTTNSRLYAQINTTWTFHSADVNVWRMGNLDSGYHRVTYRLENGTTVRFTQMISSSNNVQWWYPAVKEGYPTYLLINNNEATQYNHVNLGNSLTPTADNLYIRVYSNNNKWQNACLLNIYRYAYAAPPASNYENNSYNTYYLREIK